MNGYLIRHETQINRQAAAIRKLAAEYNKLISEAEAAARIQGWETPAADEKRRELQAAINEAKKAVASLQKISNDLYAFTASHKTWLEDVVDLISQ